MKRGVEGKVCEKFRLRGKLSGFFYCLLFTVHCLLIFFLFPVIGFSQDIKPVQVPMLPFQQAALR